MCFHFYTNPFKATHSKVLICLWLYVKPLINRVNGIRIQFSPLDSFNFLCPTEYTNVSPHQDFHAKLRIQLILFSNKKKICTFFPLTGANLKHLCSSFSFIPLPNLSEGLSHLLAVMSFGKTCLPISTTSSIPCLGRTKYFSTILPNSSIFLLLIF